MDRVTADNLAFAAEWLDCYDGTGENGDVEGEAVMHRVADWLRAEAARREEAAAVRQIVARTGHTPATVRAHLRRRIAQNQEH